MIAQFDLAGSAIRIDPSPLIIDAFWLTQLLNGIVLGMILVIMSVGLTVVLGIMRIVNFAHGEFLLVGTYLSLAVFQETGSFALGVLAAIVGVSVVGLITERFFLRRTYDYNLFLQLLLTFGIAEMIRGLIQIVWGRSTLSYPTPGWAAGRVDLVAFSYPLYRLFLIAFGAIVMVAAVLFITRTKMGLLIRAGAEDREMVDLLGVDVAKIYTIVFIIGAALAGIAGAMIGPIRSAYPTLGIEILVPTFVVVIVGGMGSIRGSVVAGLLIGIISVLTTVVYPQFSEIVIYLILAVVLLVRPEGLFGQEGVFQ